MWLLLLHDCSLPVLLARSRCVVWRNSTQRLVGVATMIRETSLSSAVCTPCTFICCAVLCLQAPSPLSPSQAMTSPACSASLNSSEQWCERPQDWQEPSGARTCPAELTDGAVGLCRHSSHTAGVTDVHSVALSGTFFTLQVSIHCLRNPAIPARGVWSAAALQGHHQPLRFQQRRS